MPATIISNWLGETGMPFAVEALSKGLSPLDIVESGIKPVEANPKLPHVGIGGATNMLGELETDASIMDGDTLQAGSVGALIGYKNSISVARLILEKLPHVMLVGKGVAIFAHENGLEKIDQLPPEVIAAHQQWLKRNIIPEILDNWPNVPLSGYTWPKPDIKSEKDTVIFLTRNKKGQFAGGASTSGWDYKYPGRLGDSPIIGAGLYVNSKYGACACTHTGEMTIRDGTSVSVVKYMKMGFSIEDACHEAVKGLREIKRGYVGPVVIHAMDKDGKTYVVTTSSQPINYVMWSEESNKIEILPAVVDEIKYD